MKFSFVVVADSLDEFLEIIQARVAKFGVIEWMNEYSLKHSMLLKSGICRGEIVVTDKVEYNKTKLTNIELIEWLHEIDAGAKRHASGNDYILRHKVPKSKYAWANEA